MDLATVHDRRGVSPVIGVILMVAITVILASVIAVFVIGVGQDSTNQTAPGVPWDIDQPDNRIELDHPGGPEAPADDYRLQVVTSSGSSSYDLTGGSGYGASATIQAGDRFKLYESAPSGSPGPHKVMSESISDVEEVRLIWEGDGTSNTVATWTA